MNLGLIWGPIGGLFAFGYLYDRFVGWLEREGYDEGYTAILVVVGTLVTLLASIPVDVAVLQFSLGEARSPWAIAPVLFLGKLATFAASGAPMVVGSITRYAKRRRQGQEPYRNGGGGCR
jgi:hypothetical protein